MRDDFCRLDPTKRSRSLTAVCIAMVSVLFVSSHAGAEQNQTSVDPPSGGDLVSGFDDPSQVAFLNGIGNDAVGDWVTGSTGPPESVFRTLVKKRPKQAWDTQLKLELSDHVAAGHRMLLTFWVRCLQSDDESGSGHASFYVQPKNSSPRFSFPFDAGPEWRQFNEPFVLSDELVPGVSNVVVHVASMPQTLEFGDVRLLDYGADYDLDRLPRTQHSYEGREADAAWRVAAQERIRKIRQAELKVQVVDSDGRPVPSAKVRVSMRRHAFPFGTAVNAMMLGGEGGDFPLHRHRQGTRGTQASLEDAERYRSIVEKYFNRVTFEGGLRPHVWKLGTQRFDARQGRLHKVMLERTIPWLQSKDISIRGHYIGWGALDHTPLQRDYVGDPEGHRRWLWEHMADILPATSGSVSEWDTINHIIGWGRTYEDEHGGFQIHADILAEARRLAPDALHAINEGQILPGGSRRQDYRRVIRFLEQQGQAPDVVGFMGHFDSASLTAPTKLLSIYDRFAEVAPRLQLTELDVDTAVDEELQADYLRDVMIASFSHPNIDAIVMWGFWEDQHWKPDAALWRSDWTIKPAGQAFVDLVSQRWWTDETLTTDAAGQVELRAFLGDYDVIVTRRDAETKIGTTLRASPGSAGAKYVVRLQLAGP